MPDMNVRPDAYPFVEQNFSVAAVKTALKCCHLDLDDLQDRAVLFPDASTADAIGSMEKRLRLITERLERAACILDRVVDLG